MVSDWDTGAAEELSFWRAWLSTGGLEWPADFKYRTNPKSRLQADIANLNVEKKSPYEILDVGAGPLTIVGKYHPDFTVHVTAIDALARKYEALLSSLQITPLVKTVQWEAESLSEANLPSFDVTFAHNALDHMRDPILVLRQMIGVTNVGGHVVLKHVRNVADAEAHAGLHQWNISTADRRLMVAGVDIAEAFATRVKVVKLSHREIWDTAILQRIA